MGILDRDQLGQLRQAMLEPNDATALRGIAKCGGTCDAYPEKYPIDYIRWLDRMVAKGFVVLVDPKSRGRIALTLEGNVGRITARCGSRIQLALTDEGRSILSSLDKTIEVAAG